VRAVLRAAPWGVVLTGSAAGALLLVLSAGLPRLGAATFVPLALALLAGSASFALDEPAAAAVDATPTSLRARTVRRVVVALVPLGAGALALLVVGRHAPEVSIPAVLMVLAGCVLVSVATASGLRRRVAAPGETAGAIVGLSIVAVWLFEPLSRWMAVLPTSSDAAWGRTALLWSVLGAGCLGALVWTTRDRIGARRPRGRAWVGGGVTDPSSCPRGPSPSPRRTAPAPRTAAGARTARR
jgi:hypothetical protein